MPSPPFLHGGDNNNDNNNNGMASMQHHQPQQQHQHQQPKRKPEAPPQRSPSPPSLAVAAEEQEQQELQPPQHQDSFSQHLASIHETAVEARARLHARLDGVLNGKDSERRKHFSFFSLFLLFLRLTSTSFFLRLVLLLSLSKK